MLSYKKRSCNVVSAKKGSSSILQPAINVRKLTAVSSLLWNVDSVDDYKDRAEQLQEMLDATNAQCKSAKAATGHPLLSSSASLVRKEVLNIALAEGQEIMDAADLVKSKEFSDALGGTQLHSVLAFPPPLHAEASRSRKKPRYKPFHNTFANLLHIDRSTTDGTTVLDTVKDVNRNIQACLFASTNPRNIAYEVKKNMMTRGPVHLGSVPCHHYGQAVMTQINNAIDTFLRDTLPLEPASSTVNTEEGKCQIALAAHSIFEGMDVQKKVNSLYDTRHKSTEANIHDMRQFLDTLTDRLGLRDVAKQMKDSIDPCVVYTGLVGSIAANGLLSAYGIRCASSSQDRVDTYMKALNKDFEESRLALNMAALPVCIDTLRPESTLEKRLFVQNAAKCVRAGMVSKESAAKKKPQFKDLGTAARITTGAMRVANTILAPIDKDVQDVGGLGGTVTDAPIQPGSEYKFDYFDDMSVHAVREVINGLRAE